MTLEEFLTDLQWDFRQIGKLQSAVEVNKSTPVQELHRLGTLPDEQMHRLFEIVYNCRYVPMSQVIFDRDATLRFGAKLCVDKTLAFGRYNGNDIAIIADPSDEELMQLLHKEEPIAIYTTDMDALVGVIDTSIRPLVLSQISNTINVETDNLFRTVDLATVGDSAINDLIKQLVKNAFGVNASDVQIIPMQTLADVYFRVDGIRMLITQIDKAAIAPLHRVLGMLAKQQTEDERKIVEGKFSFTIDNTEIELRLNIIPTRNGASINLRLLPQTDMSIADVTTSDQIQKVFSSIINMTEGMVLFCGPTGSGKSTSMITLAKKLLQKNINICSIEDPVEQVVPGINQVDFSEAKGLTYTTVTKAFLRHDPDVIIIGEIRDAEVASVAIQAADTGHLVLSTLHTKDALSTINRLINLGVDRVPLAENLSIIVAQKLVRRVCPHCAKKISLAVDDKRRDIFSLGDGEITCYEAVGCTECNRTGYSGRICICETLIISKEIRDLIEQGAHIEEFERLLAKEGHADLLADGIAHVLRGETTFDELTPIITNMQIKRGELANVEW